MDESVTDNPAHSRFELAVGGATALVHYTRHGKALVLDHTEVPPDLSGQGIGSRLAEGVFENLRLTGRKAGVRCSFLLSYLERHPDYADVVEG
jgi:predicted GNAT family acetyltransferase